MTEKKLFPRLGIILLVLLAVFFVLMGLLKYALNSDRFSNQIRAAVNAKIPGSLMWESIRISPGAGRIAFKGLSLKDKSNQEVLYINQLGLTIRLGRLVQKELVFDQIIIEHPRMNLVVAENNRTNLLDALVSQRQEKPTDTGDSGMPFVKMIFNRVKVMEGRVRLQAPQSRLNLSAVVEQAGLKNFSMDPLKGVFNINARDVTYQAGDMKQGKISVNLDAEMSQKNIIIRKANICSMEGDVDIAGNIDLAGSVPRADLAVLCVVYLEPVAELFKLNSEPKGTVKADLTLKGGLDNPNATLSLSSERLDAAGHAFNNLQLTSWLKGHQLTVDASTVRTEFGMLAVSGKMDLSPFFKFRQNINPAAADDIRYTVKAKMEKTDISVFFPAQRQVKGIVDTDIDLQGIGFHRERMKTTFDIRVREREVPGAGERRERLQAGLSGKIEGSKLMIPEFRVNGFGAAANGTVSYGFDTGFQDHSLSLSIPDLSLLSSLSGVPVSGSLNMTGGMSGHAGNLEGQIVFSGAEIDYGKIHINSIEAVSHLDKGRLFIDDLKVTPQSSSINASGSFQLFRPGSVDLNIADINIAVKGEKINPGEFYNNITGLVSLSGQLTGTPDQPEGRFTLSGSGIRIHGEQIDVFDASADLMNGEIKINVAAEAGSPKAEIKGSGRYDIGQKIFSADLQARSFPVKTVAHLREKVGEDGTIDLDLRASGRVENPSAEAALMIKGMKAAGEDLPDMDISLVLKEKELNLKSLFYGEWKGGYHLDTKRFQLNLETDRLKLAPLMRMAGQKDFSGEMKGRLTVSGDTDNLKAVHADLDISELAVFLKETEIIRSERVRLQVENGKISSPGIVFSLFKEGKGHVALQNSVTESFGFLIRITLPVSAVDPVFEQISDLSGDIKADIRVSGNVLQPEVKGTLTFHEIGMALPFIANEFSRLNGDVHFNHTTLFSEGITGFLGDGRFKLAGKADIEKTQIKDASMRLECIQLPLDFPGIMDLKVDGNLQFTGSPITSALTGNLFLVEGRYYKDIRIDLAGMTKPRRPAIPALQKEPNPFLDGMSLNIDLDKKVPFLVENNLCTMSVSPDLTLYGTGTHPLISGRLEIAEGTIRFQKKEFDIKKGSVDFVSPYRVEPMVDLEAQADIRQWQVTLKLSGPLDNLDFVLSSEPEESHADILSLIAVGKTTRELRSSQGGGGFSPAMILADFLAETVQKNVKDQTGLDQVEIHLGDGEDGSPDSGSIVLGKELSRQLSVRYGVELRGGENLQRVASEYRILEALIMNAYQDSAGDFGGGIKLRLEF